MGELAKARLVSPTQTINFQTEYEFMMFRTTRPEASSLGNSIRILLVGFPTQTNDQITRDLGEQNYSVVAADSVTQARRLFEAEQFDFVVVDVANIDLFAPRFIHELRSAETPSLNYAVVAVDSSGFEGLRMQLTQSGADLVIQKLRFADLNALRSDMNTSYQ